MNWREDPRWETISRVELPNLCIALRMSLNGAADPMRQDEEQKIIDYIRVRLEQWQPTRLKIEEKMDEAIRQLCYATLEVAAHYRDEPTQTRPTTTIGEAIKEAFRTSSAPIPSDMPQQYREQWSHDKVLLWSLAMDLEKAIAESNR